MTITFSVPFGAELLIKKGQEVDFDTPFIKTTALQTIEIDLATKLSTKPKNIFQYLKKFVGDVIHKGDLLAQSSSFLSNKSYFSEHEGVIKEVDHNRGVLIIEVTSISENNLLCYFKGEIVEIENNKIHLKVKHAKDFELASTNEYFGGETIYSKDPEKDLEEDQVKNKVVVDDNIPEYEQAKYNALGATGFVFFHTLSEYKKVPNAKLKDEGDFKSIVSAKLPYCIIDKSSQTIYFYE